MKKLKFLILLTVIPALLFLFAGNALSKDTKGIVHDAEYYVLEAQHGEKWAAQDKELDKKLAELSKKTRHPTEHHPHHVGRHRRRGSRHPANPEDARLGNAEHQQVCAGRIFFTRMYTEPCCTPSRAAAMTGRHAIRNGMYNVGFPYEYGGLADDEVTMAEVLSEAVTPPPSTASRISATLSRAI